MKRRILSIITALALCLSLCPTWALAAEGEPDTGLCDHHRTHTAECGYTAPTEGQPCGHVHTAECYTLGYLPDDEPGDEPGQTEAPEVPKKPEQPEEEPAEEQPQEENLLYCQHEHDETCGYVPADPGTPCGYVCKLCPIEDLIAALPDEVTAYNRDEVEARLQEILSLYADLTEEEAEQVDISRCQELQWQLDEASVPVTAAAGDTYTVTTSGLTISSSNRSQYNGATLTTNGNEVTAAIVINGVDIELTISNLNLVVNNTGGIVLQNGATLTLKLKGKNKVRDINNTTNAAIKVPEGCTLIIDAVDDDDENNSLRAVGGAGAAGIGANAFSQVSREQTVGTIIINGGNIYALGSGGGSGIGGSLASTTGKVTINGGIVEAHGSASPTLASAAGIGSGLGGHLESITITGGTIKAIGGGDGAAGIGAGGTALGQDVVYGNITINGGTITDTTIGYDDSRFNSTNSSITIGENANLPGCTVYPLPDSCENYTFKGTIYDTDIKAGDVVFTVAGLERTVRVTMSSSEPYRGDFSVEVLMPKKASVDTSVTWGSNTLVQNGVSVSGSGSNVTVTFGTQNYKYYTINGTIYDESITQNEQITVTVDGTDRTVQMTYAEPYSGVFKLDKIPLDKEYDTTDISVEVKAGSNTWSGTATGNGTAKTLTIGTQTHKLYTITGTINDTRITGDMTGTAEFLGKTYAISLTATPPYAGTFTLTNIPLKIADADAGFDVNITLNGGITLTGKVAASDETSKALTIGDQKYKYYTINGTIHDGRITGNANAEIEATINAQGYKKNVTLTKGSGYSATFSATNVPLPYPQADTGFPVTVTWNGITRNGTVAASSGTTKSLTIGEQLYKVTLNFLDNAITQDITVNSLTVTQSGKTLGQEVLAGGTTLKMSQTGTGSVDLWAPAGATDISITIPGVNGGQPITGNFTIKAGTNIVDLYEEEIGQLELDLYYGDIVFEDTGNSLKVNYYNAPGTQQEKVNLSYDDIYVIKQSNSSTATGNQLKVNSTKQELKIRLNGVNISRSSGSPISIEQNCKVNLQTASGTTNIAKGNNTSGVYVGVNAALTLSGDGTLKAEGSGSGAAIGGYGNAVSGQINIKSGTVEATSKGNGAAIGGGSDSTGGAGNVTISGGTVRAKANGYGAAIGGGGSYSGKTTGPGGKGNVTITGGNVTAETTGKGGAAIGGGGYGFWDSTPGAGNVTITNGTVSATCNGGSGNAYGAAIGNGYSDTAREGGTTEAGSISISGGTVTARIKGKNLYGSAIGGTRFGKKENVTTMTINISGGIITAEAAATGSAYGGAIASGGTNSVAAITISGGTIKATVTGSGSQDGSGIGNGAGGGDATTVTITGGTIQAKSTTTDDKRADVETPKNSGGTALKLVDITLTGASDKDLVTKVEGLSGYTLTDVYPRNNGHLYFYLPDGTTLPTSITAGGVKYLPESSNSTTYAPEFTCELNGYTPEKEYDGNPMAAPADSQVTTNGKPLTYEWYQGNEKLSSAPVNAGAYTLKAVSQKGSKSFAVEIKKKPLTIMANDQTIVYGGSIAQTEFTSTGVATGDTLAVTLTASQTAVGTHTGAITATAEITGSSNRDVSTNYEITYKPGTLTIDKATPAVNNWPTASAITYGQALNASTLTGGDTSGTFAWKDDTVKPGAGTASCTVVFTPNDKNNYSTVFQDVSVTVNPANLTITATDQTITYGNTVEAGVGKVEASGLITGDTLTAVQLSASATNAGTHENGITVTGAKIENGNTDVTSNYTITYTNGKLTIQPKTISNPTIELSPDSFVYDGEAKEPSVTVKDGNTVIPENEYNVSYSNNTDVGDATVTITDNEGGNYIVSGTKTFAITAPSLSNANVSVTGTYTYNGSKQTPMVEVTLGGKTLVKDQDYTVSCESINAGDGTVTITGKGNYTGEKTATFTIGKAPITVTGLSGTANKTYDGKTDCSGTGLTIQFDGKISNDDVSVTGIYEYKDANAGDKKDVIAKRFSLSGSDSGNYELSTNPTEVSAAVGKIVKATVTSEKIPQNLNIANSLASTYTFALSNLRPKITGEWGTVEYEIEVNFTEPGYYSSGAEIVAGPSGALNTLSLPVLFNAVEGTGQVGTVKVTVKSANYADFTNEIHIMAGNKKKVTFSGVEGVTTVYNGQQVTGYTGTLTATDAEGNTVELTPEIRYTGRLNTSWDDANTPPTDAGTYFVVFRVPDDNKDYIGRTNVAFEITPAHITITADNQEVTAGESMPKLTYQVDRLYGNDQLKLEPVPYCDADLSKAGTYPITFRDAEVPDGGNYDSDITYVAGTLTVKERPVDPTPVIPVNSVRVNPTSQTLKPGEGFHLTATVEPSNTTQSKDVTWSSSNPTVAEVDSSGNVIARTPGTAEITVRTVAGGFTASCTVTVEVPEAETFTIIYHANGGTGTMPDGIAPDGEPFILPECSFTAPEGKEFVGWSIGGTSGVIVDAGGSYTFTRDMTVFAVWQEIPAETYTVTYNANGGTGTAPVMADAAEGTTFVLPDSPFSRAGYQFSGWSYGGVIYAAGTMFTMPDSDVTFTAQWTQLTYASTGNVLQDGMGVPDAIVTLMRGMITVATERTDANGRFTFSGVPVGTYNLRVDKDGITKTVKQEITSGNTDMTIILPNGRTNSVVKVKNEETPPVVVGGLDQVFTDTSVYTPEDQEIVNNGGTVEFKLTVEKQDAPPEAVKIETVKKENETVALYLDLTLTKTVTHSDSTATSATVSEVRTLIETIVPLPEELQGKVSYAVYRVHNGVAEPLPENSGSEYYTVSSDKTSISIFARKYSTYAIAWSDEAETPPTPPTPSRPTGGGGGSSVRTYAVTVEKSEHGTVTASRVNAASGTTVTLTVTPDTGYVLFDLAVTDSQGNPISVTDRNTFTMPSRAVTVKASFAPMPDESQEKPCDGGADCPSRAYADLNTGTWYHEAVDYAIREGLLTGYGNGTFNPNGNLSRAMLAQILYNKAGRPSVNGGSSFMDVAPDSWYADAIIWAAAQGIGGGYGNGKFGPNDPITREQLAVMLWRYSKEPAATDKELHFSDANQASSWALEALRWAAENGVLNGYGDGRLGPQGQATRAQTAQMLKNFLESQEERT